MLFDITARRCELMDGQLYIEFIPYNNEIKDLIFHGGTYDLIPDSVGDSTKDVIEDTVEFYKSSVRDEMYNNLPDEIKSGYTNCQFKINNSIDDPSQIDYDILGFRKKRTVIKGELRQIEYYRDYIFSSDTYSDLVVTESREYIRDGIGIVQYRNQTSNWICTNNQTGLTINFTKYYSTEEAIQEGIDRRSNMIGFAKTALLSGLKSLYGEPANQTYAFDLLLGVTTQMNYFLQGYTQPLRDALSASTKAYLTTEIKTAVINQLIF